MIGATRHELTRLLPLCALVDCEFWHATPLLLELRLALWPELETGPAEFTGATRSVLNKIDVTNKALILMTAVNPFERW